MGEIIIRDIKELIINNELIKIIQNNGGIIELNKEQTNNKINNKEIHKLFLKKYEINLIVDIIDYALADGYGDIRGYDNSISILKKLINEINLDKDTLIYFNERYGIHQ